MIFDQWETGNNTHGDRNVMWQLANKELGRGVFFFGLDWAAPQRAELRTRSNLLLYHTVNAWATETNNSANTLITWAGKPTLHGHAPQVWKCVCSPDYLFILFDSGWCSSIGLLFFPPYLASALAPCPLFKISKICGLSLPCVSPSGEFHWTCNGRRKESKK